MGQLVNDVILSEAGKIEEFPREVEESVPFSGEYGSFDSPSTSLRVAQDDSPKQGDKLKFEQEVMKWK